MAKGKIPVARIEGAEVESVAPQDARSEDVSAGKTAKVSVAKQEPAKSQAEAPKPAETENEAKKPVAKPAEAATKAEASAAKSAEPKLKVAAQASQPKAKPKTKPKTKVASAAEPEKAAEKPTEADGRQAEDEPNDALEQARSIGQAFKTWMAKTFPGHVHAVIGGLCGLLVAVLFFVFGFWKTMLVCLLVAIGVAFGQYLDGDPRIVNLIRKLVSEGRGGN